MFPSILIQLENGPNDYFFSSTDTNLSQKKSVKQKIKKLWPYGINHVRESHFYKFHYQTKYLTKKKDRAQLTNYRLRSVSTFFTFLLDFLGVIISSFIVGAQSG